jgi:hypothetical protein
MTDKYPQGGNLFDMAKEGTKGPSIHQFQPKAAKKVL